MQVPILIEPIEGGLFRARTGEPLALSVEADSAEHAKEALIKRVEERLQAGAVLSVIHVNGTAGHFDFAPLPEDDWFFESMRESIEENRARIEAGA